MQGKGQAALKRLSLLSQADQQEGQEKRLRHRDCSTIALHTVGSAVDSSSTRSECRLSLTPLLHFLG